MSEFLRKSAAAYAGAFATVLAAVAIRGLLDPLLGDRAPFLLPFFAVIAAAWYGGINAGLVAVVLGLFAANYFFVSPRFTFVLGGPTGESDGFRFVLIGICTSVLCGLLRARNRQIADKQQQLQDEIAERRRAEVVLTKQSERQRLLWEAAAVLLTTDEPDAMLRGLFAKIAAHFSLDAYIHFMVNENGDALRLQSCIGIPEETAHGIQRLDFGQAICGSVAVCRQPIVVDYVQQSADPRAHLVKGFGIRVCACHPLQTDGELFGTLSFASRTRDQFDADELEFLRTISHYVTVAYERLRLIAALRDRDRRKDEFLAVLAHELRNPLAPIRNALEIMRLAPDDAPVIEESRSLMERQVMQMVRLIDDLLDVSRITRGKLELRKEPVELDSVVRSAVETCRPLIEQSSHRLTVDLPAEPVWIEGDKTRLAQVLANLLNNAAKFTPTGGEIGLSAALNNGEIVLRIKDTGIGVAPEMLPRLFEMFMQGDRSLEKAYGGLGIGLNLAQRLIEMHGGSIAAASEGIGKGCEMTVRLPTLASVPISASPAEDGNGDGVPAPLRILVADDNRDAADSLAGMLRMLGHEVRTAHDGAEAVESAIAFHPDVALLDIGMPQLNGYDVARSIRQQVKDVVLVALTGWGQAEDKTRSQAAGFDHHLTKPAAPAALSKVLSTLTPSAS
jgi:signal transduction histidine kinase